MRKLVYTAGTFDLLHVGHVRLLKACRSIAGEDGLVVVALNTDEFIREYKGEHPVMPFAERREMLLALRTVDRVYAGSGWDSTKSFLNVMNVEGGAMPWERFIVIGSDWATKDYGKQTGFTYRWLQESSVSLVYVPYTPGVSTSKLRRHLCD
jgi:glycerol-3-phosphate cytidylyltransferase